MKPGFALSLSFEGISLLQRAAGGWRMVGEVALDTTDLAGELAGLRDKAVALASGVPGAAEIRCKVVIPNDQIRYLSLDTGSFNGEARLAMVKQALEGATPYPVDDLAFDLSLDGPITHVAAVVRDTLAEAEAFATEHGFNPVSFVAAPDDNPFLGEPHFGVSAHAATLPDADQVEPDGIAVVVIGPAEIPAPEPEPQVAPQAAPLAAPEPEPVFDPLPGPVTTGFSSRRGKIKAPDTTPDPAVVSGAPSLGGANRAAPEPTKPSSETFGPSDETPQQEPPEPVSVTAPTLDIPENTTEPQETPATGLSGFLSRRKKSSHVEPARLAPPPAQVPPAPEPIPEPIPDAPFGPEVAAVSSPPGNAFAAQADEADRMTVFGARGEATVGGKPRHLGLVLSVALLLFLAAVAAWASIFLEDGVAGLFRSSPARTELAAVPDTPGIGVKADNPARPVLSDTPEPAQHPPAERPGTAPDVGPDVTPDITPDIAVASPEEPATFVLVPPNNLTMPGLPAPRHLDPPTQPAAPELSDTDSAVLDALQQPQQDDHQSGPDPVAAPPEESAQDAVPPTAIVANDILQTAPEKPETPSIIGLDDLYVASIDRTDLSQDAVALPGIASLATDLPLGAVISPVAAGTAFDLDTSGLVVASVEGTLNPDGVMVYLGRPPAVPPRVPTRFETEPETETANVRLAGLRPRLRPGDLEERFQRDNLGGLTRDELAGRRPRARPESHQQEAKPDAAPTAQAVVSSRVPKSRPGNFAAIVSAAIRPAHSGTGAGEGSGSGGRSGTEQAASVAPRAVTPTIPSSASVARQATLKNEINLRRVNLIGVYGSPSNRRALVRLPSGRYKKVKVGDTVDGGRIVAIGDSELRYQKSGRNMTLKIPSS